MRALGIIFIFIVSLLAVGLLSCSRKTTSSVSASVEKDSVRIEYKDRLVEVPIPGDTVEVEKRIECDPVTGKPKPFIKKKRSGRATIKVQIDSAGDLTAVGVCDSLIKVINAKDQQITIYKERIKELESTVTKFKLGPIGKIAIWFMVIVLVISGLIIFLKFKGFL